MSPAGMLRQHLRWAKADAVMTPHLQRAERRKRHRQVTQIIVSQAPHSTGLCEPEFTRVECICPCLRCLVELCHALAPPDGRRPMVVVRDYRWPL